MTGDRFDPRIAVAGSLLDDVERLRLATASRMRVLTQPADRPDADGVCRGFGLDTRHPDVAALAALLEALIASEDHATTQLRRAVEAHHIGPWVTATVGLGHKQVGRLLALVGDPCWNTSTGAPRTVSQLWAYCGLHVVDGRAPRRAAGHPVNWSPVARSRAYLIALSCIRARRSPYRAVYDDRRAYTTEHRPTWTVGHQHADAMRVTAKAILRDLYRAAAADHPP